MKTEKPFEPDWVSPPGDTLSDLLMGKAVKEFCDKTGWDETFVMQLFSGHARIDASRAELLAKYAGGTEAFWLRREQNYRKRLKELEQPESKKRDKVKR